MPVRLTKIGGGKVRVSTPSGTKAKAEAQERLLNAVEHGWVPTRSKPTKRKAK